MEKIWNIKSVLDWMAEDFSAREIPSPRLEGELLLCHVLQCERIKLYTDFDRPLSSDELQRVRNVVQQRRQGVCTAHIVGTKEFWSLPFKVCPEVLVPRPDTETLVEEVLKRNNSPGTRFLDMCTGTGCIAIALATEIEDASFVAADISPIAVDIARENAQINGVADRVSVVQSNLFSNVDTTAPFDVIVANPPYVKASDLPGLSLEVRSEPHLALIGGGQDGLDFIRTFLGALRPHVKRGGGVYIELDSAQATPVADEIAPAILGAKGSIINDLTDRARVVVIEM